MKQKKQINHYFNADDELLKNSVGLTARQFYILGAIRMFQNYYGCFNQGLDYFIDFYHLKKADYDGIKEDFNVLGRRNLLVATKIENGISIKLGPAYKRNKNNQVQKSNECF